LTFRVGRARHFRAHRSRATSAQRRARS